MSAQELATRASDGLATAAAAAAAARDDVGEIDICASSQTAKRAVPQCARKPDSQCVRSSGQQLELELSDAEINRSENNLSVSIYL